MKTVSIPKSKNDYLESFMKKNNIEKDYLKYDSVLQNIDIKIDKWLDKVDEEDKEIFLYLFSNLTYMSRFNVQDRLKELYDEYKTIEPNFSDTIFMPVSSFGGVFNGAVNIIECFEQAVVGEKAISKKNIAIDYLNFSNSFNLNSIKNIVFLDDIIGSGTTFIDFIYRISSQVPDLIDKKNLYIFSLVNLKKGVEKVNAFSNELEWDIKMINKNIEHSIFEKEEIYPNSEVKLKHKEVIEKYEKNLTKEENEKIYFMGYKRSGSAVAFFYNTPNNTLSIFWKSKDEMWYPPLPRKEDNHKFDLKNKNIFQEFKQLKLLRQKRTEYIKKQRENRKNELNKRN